MPTITSTRSLYLNFCPLYSAKNSDPNTPSPLDTLKGEGGGDGRGVGGRGVGGRGKARLAKGKGEGGRGKARPAGGRYIGGQRGGEIREEGTLHRSAVALPSYTIKTHTKTHVAIFRT